MEAADAPASWLIPPASEIAPDRAQAEQFARSLFDGMSGWVNLRGIEEPAPSGRKARVHEEWHRIDYAMPGAVATFVETCAANGFAAYVLPHPVREQGRGLSDILVQRAFAVDIDTGDIAAKRGAIVAVLGEPWIVVRSGGTAGGQPKVHLHYRLTTDALPGEFAAVAEARAAIAKRFGADEKVGRNPAQILRIPGGIWSKNPAAPAVCTLEAVNPYAARTVAEYGRASGLSQGQGANVVPFSFDFSADRPHDSGVERVLTQPVLAEGKSEDGLTRFEAAGKALGHFIRCMRDPATGWTEAQAWQAACDWNAATLVPPWSEERLRGDFNRLLRLDVEARGPFIPPQPPIIKTEATRRSVLDWNISKFAGPAPTRRWLVEGLIPLGTAGVFAAVGDAGKSMLALQLALHIGTAPPPAANPALDFSAPRFFGQAVVGRGAAVILTAEDDADEVHRRLAALDKSDLRASSPRVYVRPMISDGGPRAILADGPSGPVPTEFWAELRADLLSVPDLRLVVLDPLSHFAAVNLDNDNRAGAALMSMLGALAAQTGAAVMLVHHMGKSAAPTNLSDARTAIRGASALVDNGRWSLALWEANSDDAYKVLKPLGQDSRAKQAGVVYFGGLAKGNAPGAKMLRTLVRNAGSGLLEDVTEELKSTRPQQAEIDELAYRALKAEAENNVRFGFTPGIQGLWKAWQPVFAAAGVPVTREEVQPLFLRLLALGRLERTQQMSGGHAVHMVSHEQNRVVR